MDQEDYSSLSRDQLIDRINLLKSQLEQYQQSHPMSENALHHQLGKSDGPSHSYEPIASTSKSKTKKRRPKSSKELDFKNYSQRKIALMVSYEGSQHGGLAWQPELTKLTTVEGELFKALLISRLVEGSPQVANADSERSLNCEEQDDVNGDQNPERWRLSVDINKWGYSRAGRTDAGVSGSGQVVSLWVRSRLKSVQAPFGFRSKHQDERCSSKSGIVNNDASGHQEESGETTAGPDKSSQESLTNHQLGPADMDNDLDELPYHTILNAILPSSIRILAWSPVEEGFDARFSCLGRHYKYFFSIYESDRRAANGNKLDIEAMRDGARRLVGEHDFRNFCKIDPSKQLQNFSRQIHLAQINPVDDVGHHDDQLPMDPIISASDPLIDRLKSHSPNFNRLYVFDLIGSAFLYNMVRHIVSILFLIGSGLESPHLIERLFYTELSKAPASEHAEVDRNVDQPVDCKPEYEHSSSLPLLLYKCIYPEGSLKWYPTPFESINSTYSTTNQLFIRWSTDRIKTALSYHHMHSYDRLIIDFHRQKPLPSQRSISSHNPSMNSILQPLGAAHVRLSSNAYKPILDRPRNPHFSVTNLNWWNKIGAKKFAKRHA